MGIQVKGNLSKHPEGMADRVHGLDLGSISLHSWALGKGNICPTLLLDMKPAQGQTSAAVFCRAQLHCLLGHWQEYSTGATEALVVLPILSLSVLPAARQYAGATCQGMTRTL